MKLFNKKANQLQQLEQNIEAKKLNIVNLLKEIADYNFQKKESVDVLTDDINHTINKLASELNKSMLSLSNDITKIMDFIISIDVTNNNTISNFGKVIEDTRTFVESNKEISTSINEIAAGAEHIAEITQEATEKSTKSKESIHNAARSFESMYSDFMNISRKIENLDNDMNEITDIINVIKGIAEQTNLLALNASIEAARAGEHGKGFAVVAQEIHKLAQGTKQSIESITDKITKVRTESKETVVIVNESSKKAKEVLDDITSVENSFGDLMEAFNKSSDGIINIVPITNQQNAAINESNEKIKAILKMLENNQVDLENSMETISGVISLVEHLRKFLGGFKLDYRDEDIINLSKTDHYMWIWKLYRYLHGYLNIDIIASHTECRLGKWYYSEESSRFKNCESFKKLEGPHKQIHGVINDLVQYYKNGQKDKAFELYKRVEELSSEVIYLLDQLLEEKKMGKRPVEIQS